MRVVRPAFNHQVGAKLLHKGHNELRGIQATALHDDQSHCNEETGQNLKAELGTRRKPQISTLHHFYIVVRKSNCGEGARGSNGEPDEDIAQIRPQQGGNHDGNGNEQTSHGRGAGFLLMRLWTFLANVLSNLEFAQTVNHGGAHNEAGEKRGKTRERSPEGEIAKDAERRKIVIELDEQQPVKQSASEFSRRSRSSVVG